MALNRAPVIALAALLLAACGGGKTVEQQVIETINTMEAAAEEGRHLDFMEHVADTFGGQQGSMARREFHRFMIFQMNQHRRLHAQLFPISVQALTEDAASATFRVLVTGGGGLLPESGRLFDVRTRWINDGGDWLLDRADWEPTRLPDLP